MTSTCAQTAPVVAAEAERLVLPSLPNFRDLGGIPTRDGRHLRPRTVFRSQDFEHASTDDLQQLADAGLSLVCDLRSPKETERSPNRWLPGHAPDNLAMGITTDLRALQGGMRQYLREHPNAQGVTYGMMDTYRNMPAAFAKALPVMFDRMLDEDKLPVVIHCHAGKDRTGFTCAVLLTALGVSPDDIMEDYLLSAQRVDAAQLTQNLTLYLEELGLPNDAEVMAPAISVQPDFLRAALEVVDRDYGGLPRYIEQVAGLTHQRRERLQARLLA